MTHGRSCSGSRDGRHARHSRPSDCIGQPVCSIVRPCHRRHAPWPRPRDLRLRGRTALIVDPGPASSVDTLLDGLGRVRAARAAADPHPPRPRGRRRRAVPPLPELKVYVHERGAPHLVDPSRLLDERRGASTATEMDELWGEVAPVPEERVVRARRGRDRSRASASPTRPVTPRTTSATSHEETGDAYVGDVGGVRRPAARVHAAADAAAGHRHRGVAATRSTSSRAWKPQRALPDPLRPLRGRGRAPRPACARR